MPIIDENNGNHHDQVCSCAEGKHVNKYGEVMPTGLHRHSCAFVKLKNSFIPQAAAFADSKVPDDRGGQRWSRLFSTKMAELMREPEAEAAADDISEK